jgi:NTE family protein
MKTETFGIFDTVGNQLAEYRVADFGGGLGFGRQLGQWGEARAGIRFDHAIAEVLIGAPNIFPRAERTDSELFLRFAMDTLDDARFPRSGSLVVIDGGVGLTQLGSTADFQSLFFTAGHARSWGKNTLIAETQVALSFENVATISRLYSLGGFLRLSGLKPNERVGTDMLFFRIRGYRRVANLGLLSFRLPAYVGISIESGNTWFGTNQISAGELLWGGSAYFALDTPLAPVYIAYGNTNGDRHAAYFFVGQVF